MVTASPWQKYLIYSVIYVSLCIASLITVLSVAAFTITRIDTPDYILIPLTTVLVTASSFVDSFLIAKTFKEKGALIGLSVGLIFCAIITRISFYYGLFSINRIYLTTLASVMLAGVCGGISGVNF